MATKQVVRCLTFVIVQDKNFVHRVPIRTVITTSCQDLIAPTTATPRNASTTSTTPTTSASIQTTATRMWTTLGILARRLAITVDASSRTWGLRVSQKPSTACDAFQRHVQMTIPASPFRLGMLRLVASIQVKLSKYRGLMEQWAVQWASAGCVQLSPARTCVMGMAFASTGTASVTSCTQATIASLPIPRAPPTHFQQSGHSEFVDRRVCWAVIWHSSETVNCALRSAWDVNVRTVRCAGMAAYLS